jgi:hypothetical protein
MSSDAASLVDAMHLFLARHEEALASGEPARGMEACEGLVEALATTLPDEIGRLPDATPRHATARVVLERRVAELEGLAMQLKLAFHQLEERNVDVMRLVALLTATRRQIRALQSTLELWAAEHGAPAAREPPASEAMRAAREALAAGCAAAARAALRDALRRAGKAHDVGEGDDLVTAWRALDEVEVVLRPPMRA